MAVTTPPRVDVSPLQAALDGRWAPARELVRGLLREPAVRPADDLDRDAYRERVWQQAQALAPTRVARFGFPERFGGENDLGAYVTAFETLAHGDLSLLVKIGVHFGLFGGAIQHLGSESHHVRYLADVLSLDLPGCFAMTETGHGSDVQSLRTTATYDPDSDGFVVATPDPDARKDYIGNAALHGRVAAVFAQLIVGGESHGVHCLLVPIRDADGTVAPGVTIEDCGPKHGLEGVDNGRLSFDQVRIPRENLLDRFGAVDADGTYASAIESPARRFFVTLGTLVQGRISISGAAVSVAKSALTIAVHYALERRQFHPPEADHETLLLDYRAHQRRLLPPLARTYALHFAQAALVEQFDAVFGGDGDERARRELETRAAGTKVLTTWHATATVQECREACGGAGYLGESRLGALRADTDVFTTFEGDNTVLLQLVAKSLLTDYREEFGALDTFGTVAFVAEQVVDWVVERAHARPLMQSFVDRVPGRDDDLDVRDRAWHVRLFDFREEHVIDGVARRLRNLLGDGASSFEAFNDCQDHLLLAARVHLERLVLEAFVAAIDDVADPGNREILERLCDLHALAEVERDRAWFLEHGRMSATRSKAVIAAVNDLCAELRPHARGLVDAFAIPHEVLGTLVTEGR